MKRDPYDVLGVSRDADANQVKRAFRRLARELHPDVNSHDPAAEEKFKEAGEAYEILSDPERRATYDRYGHDGLRQGGFAPTGFSSFGDIFDAFFGSGGGEFGGFGGFGARARGAMQGADLALAVEVDLADAARGTSVDVSYEAVATCERCRGNGAEPGTPIGACPRCEGTGQLRAVARTAFGQVVRAHVCPVCEGDGRVPREPCRRCRGRGRETVERELTVDVPAGIESGQRIRLTGRGQAGERGGPPGDLYVLVTVREDPRFIRDGDDLVTLVDVPAPDASLGVDVTVATLDGEEELHVPAGTQPGAVLVLEGRGMPHLRGGRRGNQRVMINVVVPRNLSERQRELLQEVSRSLAPENLRVDGREPGDGEGLFARVRRAFR
jgi:molecular chaperone DnaJ